MIDTAETYADGAVEEVVGEASIGRRDSTFLAPKVYSWNATEQKTTAVCEASLYQLRADYLNLHLLRWMGGSSFAETVDATEALIMQGKICHWNVLNPNYDDTQALRQVSGRRECATNQVFYHLTSRGIEYDLLP